VKSDDPDRAANAETLVSMSMWVALENGAATEHLFAGRGEAYGNGDSVPRHLPQLDEAARALGLPTLNDFTIDLNVVDDSAEPPWFDPADGLACVRGLIRYLEGVGGRDRKRMFDESLLARVCGSDIPAQWHDELGRAAAAAAATDLRAFEVELAFAEGQGTRFHFLLSY
jgi:hypothetical protein